MIPARTVHLILHRPCILGHTRTKLCIVQTHPPSTDLGSPAPFSFPFCLGVLQSLFPPPKHLPAACLRYQLPERRMVRVISPFLSLGDVRPASPSTACPAPLKMEVGMFSALFVQSHTPRASGRAVTNTPCVLKSVPGPARGEGHTGHEPSPNCTSPVSPPRCGLMLTIATNLLLWLLAVTNDTLHIEIESQLREVERRFAGKAPSSRPHRC